MQEIITFYDIVNDNAEPPAPIIGDGVLLDNTILTIIGQAKAKKSFLALNFAVAIARGEGFAGFSVDSPQKVLVLSAEGGYYPTRDRIKQVTKDETDEVLKNIYTKKYVNFSVDDDDDYKKIMSMIKETQPKVVIFDPLIKFHSQDENSSAGMSTVFRRFGELIENFGISIIVVHHTGKNIYLGGRGSSFMTGEYDSCITIAKPNTGSTHKLKFDMRHVETPESRNIQFNTESLWFEEDSSNDMAAEYLAENGSKTKTEIVKDWVSSDTFSRGYGYKVIDKSLKAGNIVEADGLLQIPPDDEEEETK
jgi:putative DNA primase/helicase